MKLLHRLAGGLRDLWGKRQVERDLDEELHCYLEFSIEEKMRAGSTREQALRKARLEMGSIEGVKEGVRDAGWESMLDDFWQDIRRAPRLLRKSPGFTLVALLTLALGIGASAAMFSIVDGVLLRPLALADPGRLVALWETDGETGRRTRVPPGNYADWRAQSNLYEQMGLYGSMALSFTGEGEPERILGAHVDGGYFATLGVPPLLGRYLVERDATEGAARVIVLSQGLWQRRFGGRADVLGRRITLDDEGYEIVGVMPQGIYPTWPATAGGIVFQERYQQFWVPMSLGSFGLSRTAHVFGVVARLRPGVRLEQAQASMDTIAIRLAAEYPKTNAGEGILVTRLEDEVTGEVRPALAMLFAAVGLLLLIGCANLATLSLARAGGRARELAVRSALGATRSRLVRQLLAENVLLAVAGGLLGSLLARAGLQTLLALAPSGIPRLGDVAIDARVLGFAILLSFLTALLFGTLPALQATRPDLEEALRQGGRSGTPSRRQERARRILVTTEIALACVLAAGAGLLGRSFARLMAVEIGFDPDRVMVAEVSLPRNASREQRAVLQQELLDQLRRLPGVRAAALAYDHPLSATWYDSFTIPSRSDDTETVAWLRIVSEDYLNAMRIPLRRGRSFSPADDETHPRVAIVNEAFARRFFAGEDPVGRRLVVAAPTRPGAPRTHEIVALAGDVNFFGPSAPAEPALYLPIAQFPQSDFNLLIRTSRDPAALAPTLRGAIRAIDPDIPLGELDTMERILGRSVAQPRFSALLVSLFGAMASLLAALGVYGLLSYTVGQRRRELGVRLALGAKSRQVTRLVLQEALLVALSGIAAGLASAAALAYLSRSLLFQIAPLDPPTFAAVAAALVAAALAASYVPVRRAARIDPLEVLREN